MYCFYNVVPAAFTVIATSSDLSQSCGEFAIPSLCYNAFPLCDTSPSTHRTHSSNPDAPRARQICKDECMMLEDSLCKTEYILAKSNPVLGKGIVSVACALFSAFCSTKFCLCKATYTYVSNLYIVLILLQSLCSQFCSVEYFCQLSLPCDIVLFYCHIFYNFKYSQFLRVVVWHCIYMYICYHVIL